jgi:dynein heavy chain, axonemal
LRNFIKSLEVKINSWIKVYTDFLGHEFKTTLKNLKDFNMRTNIGLKTNPKDVFANADPHNERQKDKNRNLLMKVMRHISEMKNVKGQISVVIERMRNMVLKLKKHGIQVAEKGEEEPLQAIEASEGGFNETEKKVNEIKKDIINIIGDEAIEVKKKLDAFGIKVNDFKTEFKANLPYTYDENLSIKEIMDNYTKIDEYYAKLLKFEQEARENAELEDLFELERRNYKPLKECLSDLKNLKSLWDLIALVNLQYNDWKTKFWRQIKADVLIEQNKIFSNQIKGVNKEVRFIKGWQTLGDKVGNMTIVLNLVESLRGDYMEDRHWKQLKDKTHTEFDHKASNFCFDDILRLKLYKLKPEVEEIVDIAQK